MSEEELPKRTLKVTEAVYHELTDLIDAFAEQGIALQVVSQTEAELPGHKLYITSSAIRRMMKPPK